MPSYYNLPRPQQSFDQQSIDLYNKLPFYLALLECKYMPIWKTWEKLVGSIKWQPNMGNIMRGVRAEPTPIGRQFFLPNNITELPKKDVFTQLETKEEARVKRQNFFSQQINFNGPFADFRKDQIPAAMKDIAQQIGVTSDQFIRTDIWYKSPNIFISGKPNSNANDGFDGGEFIEGCPIADGNDAGTAAASKTTAWAQVAVSYVGNGGDTGALTYKVFHKIGTIPREDMQAPAFEAMANAPKDNETIKGKWVLVTSNEAFEALSFDNHILANRPLMMNLLNDDFSGVIGSHVAARIERFPLRIAADGTCPAPQTYETNPNAYNYGQTIVNPAYAQAPFEVAWMLGAEPYKAIQVGAPPKEFASGSMSADKFNSLNWNGEVRLNKDLLINYGNGVVDLNKFGEFVELMSDCVFGQIPVVRRYVIPIIFRRRRVQTQ